MATSAELQTYLSNVESAINALVVGRAKSYSIAGRSYTYQDLSELRNWRKELQNEIAITTRSTRGTTTFATFENL